MALEGSTQLYKHKKASTCYITIPASLANDSAFPFRRGEKLKIRIKNNKLIIEKL